MTIRTAVGDLDPKTADWMHRASDEYLRRHGRFRDLVLRGLAHEDDVQHEANDVWTTRVRRSTRRLTEATRDDLIAAYNESPDPLPGPIVDYIVAHYVKALPLKTGRKTRTRSTWEDVMILASYRHQLHKAQLRATAGLTSTPATRAKRRTSATFGISLSTLEHLLTADRQRRSALKTPPK